jgi:hypothetical protein
MVAGLTFESALSGLGSLKEAFGKYIVTPATNFGLGGFVFDIEGETRVDLTADITDHYTESNVSVQDHIAIRPKRIRLDTYVGELVHYNDGGQPTSTQKVVRKLTVVNSYLPVLSAAASQARTLFSGGFTEANFSNFVNPAANLYGFLKNALPPVTKQERAYQYFKALMESKTLVSCQTPFEFCTNMAVEAVLATQRDESRFVSNFTVVLKEIRIVSTQTISLGAIGNIINRAGIQDSPAVDGGKIQGSTPSDTLPVILKNKFGGVF